MNDSQALHLVRNPWGHSEDLVREARIYLSDRFEQVQRERDALAALCEDAAVVLERTANDTLDGRNMVRRLRGATDTSLARLKARWQAEALEAMAARFWPVGMVGKGCERDALLLRASELRRQAEESK